MERVEFGSLEECIRFRYDRFLRVRLISGEVDVTDLAIDIVSYTMQVDRDLEKTDEELRRVLSDEDTFDLFSRGLENLKSVYHGIGESEVFENSDDVTFVYDGTLYVLPFVLFWRACDEFISKYLIMKGKYYYYLTLEI